MAVESIPKDVLALKMVNSASPDKGHIPWLSAGGFAPFLATRCNIMLDSSFVPFQGFFHAVYLGL